MQGGRGTQRHSKSSTARSTAAFDTWDAAPALAQRRLRHG
jgi:hypothetical protein